VHEVRNQDAEVARLHPLGELVAEIPGGRLAHARYPQVLAQQRGGLDVKIVEGDDPVDAVSPSDVADALQQVFAADRPRHVEGFVDDLAGPVGIAEGVRRQQQHAAALAFALPQELLAFLRRWRRTALSAVLPGTRRSPRFDARQQLTSAPATGAPAVRCADLAARAGLGRCAEAR